MDQSSWKISRWSQPSARGSRQDRNRRRTSHGPLVVIRQSRPGLATAERMVDTTKGLCSTGSHRTNPESMKKVVDVRAASRLNQ